MSYELNEELREQLKAERLKQYSVRIFQAEMDVIAYEAVSDQRRLAVARKNLADFIAVYNAIEGGV